MAWSFQTIIIKMTSKEEQQKRFESSRFEREHSGLVLTRDAGTLLSFMETNIKK